MELFEWVEEGKILTQVREEIIESFCKSEEGKKYFLYLYMPDMNFSLTKLIDEIRKEYPDINLPSVVEAYYKKDASIRYFPGILNRNWEMRMKVLMTKKHHQERRKEIRRNLAKIVGEIRTKIP